METVADQQIRFFSDALPIGAFEVDTKGKCQYCNPALFEILRRTEKQILNFESSHSTGEFWLDWFAEEDKPLLQDKWKTFRTTLQGISLECRLGLTQIAEKWVHLRLQAIGTDTDLRLFGTLEDITERKAAETALKKTHKENQEILSAISAIMIGIDKQGRIRQWNKVAEETFGHSFASVKGQPLRLCGIQWDWEGLTEAIHSCQTNIASHHVENLEYQRQDSTDGFVALTLNPILGENGPNDIRGVLLLGKDITEKRQLERQLLQAQKLESIGQLAAGVAHEINTPIQFLGDNGRFLKEGFEDLEKVLQFSISHFHKLLEKDPGDKDGTAFLEIIQEVDLTYLCDEIPRAIGQSLEGVDRVASIVRAMKEFSHPGVEGKTSVDINNAIKSTITISRNEWKYIADLETNFDNSLPQVPCLVGELNQVFLNLIINASHAIGEVVGKDSISKGIIRIQTRKCGCWVEVRISDTGIGIPHHIRDKVFDPFFTTKQVGKGTGQGLAIAHSVIVDKHNGSITFESEPKKGTTFIIRLPLTVETENEEMRKLS